MIKSKPCIVDDCSNPRFAKGYCKWHQYLRTDKKPSKPNPISSNQRLKKQLHSAIKKKLIKKYGKCQLTDKRDNLTLFHCVPESRSSYLSTDERNLLLVELEYHRIWEHGTDKQRVKLPNVDKVFKIIKELDKEYYYIKLHRMQESLISDEDKSLFNELLNKLNEKL